MIPTAYHTHAGMSSVYGDFLKQNSPHLLTNGAALGYNGCDLIDKMENPI
jgi:hypothetical protein